MTTFAPHKRPVPYLAIFETDKGRKLVLVLKHMEGDQARVRLFSAKKKRWQATPRTVDDREVRAITPADADLVRCVEAIG